MNKSDIIKKYILSENDLHTAEAAKKKKAEKKDVSYNVVVESGCDFIVEKKEKNKGSERLVILISKKQYYIIKGSSQRYKVNITNLYGFLKELPKEGLKLSEVTWLPGLYPAKTAFCEELLAVLRNDELTDFIKKELCFVPEGEIQTHYGYLPIEDDRMYPENHYLFCQRSFGFQANTFAQFTPTQRVSPFFDIDSYGMGPMQNASFNANPLGPMLGELGNNHFLFKPPGVALPDKPKRITSFDSYDDRDFEEYWENRGDETDYYYKSKGWKRFLYLCMKLYEASPGLYTDMIKSAKKRHNCGIRELFEKYFFAGNTAECRIINSFHAFILIRNAFGPEWSVNAMEQYIDSGMEALIPYDFLLRILYGAKKYIGFGDEDSYKDLKVAWNYTPQKFIGYLTGGCKKQGFSDDIEGFIARWDNALVYQKILYERVREKYPDNLASYERKLSYLIRKQQSNIYEKLWKDKVEENIRYEYEGEKYRIISARSANDLIEESSRQHNCVDGYEGNVLSGKCMIFFMRYRDPKKENKSVLTIELLSGGVIGQVKASCNRAPKMRELEFVREWANEKELQFDVNEVVDMEW